MPAIHAGFGATEVGLDRREVRARDVARGISPRAVRVIREIMAAVEGNPRGIVAVGVKLGRGDEHAATTRGVLFYINSLGDLDFNPGGIPNFIADYAVKFIRAVGIGQASGPR